MPKGERPRVGFVPRPSSTHVRIAMHGDEIKNAEGESLMISLYPADSSADPYAGYTAGNGKEIWTAQEAAANLNRTGANWYVDNYGALDDGTLTYSFWSSYEQLAGSYYVTPDGEVGFAETNPDTFLIFTPEQIALTNQALGEWDDLIDISIVGVDDATQADLAYGNTDAGPASGAYTYLPYGDAVYSVYDDFYGFENAGKLGGDVWVNGFYEPNFDPTDNGSYALFTIMHESGHALGLSHPGDYNASDDNDGDNVPDPITYANDAYFFQDSNQYSIMSYFPETVTGASWVDFQQVDFTYAMTPMVHDVLAVQQMYGADMTTRAGDTTYGFNSNAGRDVFDFELTPSPVVTIWDAGGTDTLDLSGWDTDELIDLNQGQFSSASKGATLDYLQSIGFVPEGYTQAQLEATFARYGVGSEGQMHDNIAIAYGAVIENAVGGSGNDLIIGNEVANVLTGGDGIDTASYRDATSGVVASLATDRGTGGDAAGDRYVDIEQLEGSTYDDGLTGGNGGNGLFGLGGDDLLSGGNGGDLLDGGAGDDRLDGGNSGDTLLGGGGSDTLLGGNGGDTLAGGAGGDTMTGGNGSDVFAVSDLGDTDVITDFGHGHDRIDLTGIDAIAGTEASDAFTWIGADAFDGNAGEVRAYSDAGHTFVAGDVDGDTVADFLIDVGNAPIVQADLVLG
jgi:Ca2+-binding RTX toxin-like protein